MHRIGEFSAMTGLSVKTLRFYDEIGLLMPASVGSRTGYRLYLSEQASKAKYIVGLRQFGLSLAEIRAVLDKEVSECEALEAVRDRLASSISSEQILLEEIDLRLASLAARSGVRLRRLPAIRIASIKARVGSAAEAEAMLLELTETICPGADVHRGILWHHCAEAGFLEAEPFVEAPLNFSGRRAIRLIELPPTIAACALSADDEAIAESVYSELKEWMVSHGRTLVASKREIFRREDTGNSLEIQFPVTM